MPSFDQAFAAANPNKSNPNGDQRPYTPLSQREGGWAGHKAATDAASGTAPASAAAAPTATDKVFAGLCEALNAHQQYLVQTEKAQIADVYSIQFTSNGNLGAFQVVRPGQTDLSNTATTNPNTAAAKIDPAQQQVNTNSQIWQVTAGTQIIQLIDQIMRSSSYITGQQNAQISPVYDPKTGLQTQTANPKPGNGTTAWYKVTLQAKDLGYDNIRKDHAYNMTFIVAPYAITQMASQYFPDSRYRGSHKSYNYWFTGLNTQILNFEQEYNNYYRLTLTGAGKNLADKTTHDFRDQYRRTYMAASENHGQGQAGDANNPADSGASFLYSPTDQAKVNLKIVGDPAWMQQGEVGIGMIANAFNFNPFLADGTINYDSQEVVFDVNFNAPQDYNFSTGIMDVNSKTGQPQENFTYTAIKCKNTFSKGRFEQQLEGRLLIEFDKGATTPTSNGRIAAPAAPTASGSRDTKNSAAGSGYQDEASQNADGNGASAPSGYQNEEQQNADNGPPTPQPASPPGAPNSDGSIVGGSDTPPPKIDTNSPIQANAEETAAVQAYVAAGGTFPRGTGPITSGPLYDAVLSAKSSLAARQQASAVNTTPPQVIAKDDS